MAGRTQHSVELVKWISTVLIVIALLTMIRTLPLDRIIDLLKVEMDGLGLWGPFALAAVYVVAVLVFFPESGLALTAGAAFGLAWGMVIVSLASTTASALSFLMARFLARDRMVKLFGRYPKLKIIDDGIEASGWKLVALWRLSLIAPFGLGNYLFGITAIRFRPYVLASWLFMLPSSFMFVYLGHIGIQGVRSAAGAELERTWAEWALLGVGLLATIAVIVSTTRLSLKALHERVPTEPRSMRGDHSHAPAAVAACRLRGTIALALVAVVMLGIAARVHQRREALRSLFGPPTVTLQEAYQRRSDGPTFDHAAFDALLRKHVDGDGGVDYEGLGAEAESLDGYIASLGDAPFADLGRDQKLAFLINAYNACTLRLILDCYPIESIKDIPPAKRWDATRWRLGSMTLSLNQIEHEQIRPKFAEPRVHFALVCAAIGCPKLRNEAYQADRINEQLEDQTRYVHSHDRWFRYQPGAKEVHLTKLYGWYRSDFEQVANSVLTFAARYSMPLHAALEEDKKPQIKWLEYDWTLNDRKSNR